jgi:hypothetical protein
MEEGGLEQRLCRDPGTAAEFDGESCGPSAMRLFSGMFAAYQNTIIKRYERSRSKVQNAK